MKTNILVVEDHIKYAKQITRFLMTHHYHVDVINNGKEALSVINHQQPDIVLLDIVLPGMSGFEVCRSIRPTFTGKILVLTGCDEDFDQIAGLELGADGYLVKPIKPQVLLAHIRLLERQLGAQTTTQSYMSFKHHNVLTVNQLTINLDAKTVSYRNTLHSLRPAEYEVLVVLAKHADQTVTREHIIQALRGIDYNGLDRSVDVKVAAIRKQFRDQGNEPEKIVTHRNRGYRLITSAWT
ncbi:response regulator transcription factor [Vibrio coralliilyticus]|uniref:response regulator transcription factor n=1 Tax=Vibrio coralliilyticus TaxID=190893 RepID=UPI0015603D6D|nr:response regulator transcription factor [Vibrio coralliilyticus]NRF32188.1 response regulator transcription factor [Vibrio coralliilyticus]NRF53317.1 response regulator transcription factor [Vibrio coralliilyticus]NRG06218.1 response regulator transcription factor [Vibrio coralliilyticus]